MIPIQLLYALLVLLITVIIHLRILAVGRKFKVFNLYLKQRINVEEACYILDMNESVFRVEIENFIRSYK